MEEEMDKKVAIMTWYTYRNYGSVLQASALHHILSEAGYKTDMINYPPKGMVTEKNIKYLFKRGINKIKTMLNSPYVSSERNFLFDEFISDKLTQTRYCSSYPELCDLNTVYSAFLCGSDQIWSPLSYDDKYYLSFVENSNKMVAYAPSFGTTTIENLIIKSSIVSHISRFAHLSVREKQGADLIKKLTGKEAKVVLDPTLLMDSLEWDSYINVDRNLKLLDKEYIICYFLGDANKYMGYVRMLSKKIKIPFYVIPITRKQKKSKDVVPFEVGPREFVSLIRNAKYVCTDSFHGMAFSINFNIPFSVFKRFKDNDSRNQNSRIYNLLQILGLECRLVDYKNKRNIQTDISCDFSEANIKLNVKREESLNYLSKALQSAVNDTENGKNSSFKITDICCGCGACASVCSMGAISIIRNEAGFEHFFIDEEKCIRCGKCKNVCPMSNIVAKDMKLSKALYSFKSHSDEILNKSSSGGVSHEIASYFHYKRYAICGCIYDELDNCAKHIWIMPGEEHKLSFIQGSKYIQSISSKAFNQIIDVARKHKIVFLGTPCQAAAVDKLLEKKGLRNNALIVDLICHGVPSYNLWEKYLFEINEKYNVGKNPSVSFRSKEQEWRKRLIRVAGNEHVYKNKENKDDFYAFFRRGLCDMEACFDCPYRERSAADLRIGDYWGNKFLKDKQGVSMVIANNAYGEHVIDLLKKEMNCQVEKHELEEYWSIQYPYNKQRPLIREMLIDELKSKDIKLHSLRKKYCRYYDNVEKLGMFVRMLRK